MRLFGTPGGTLDQARATYGFLPPFDLSLGAVVVVPGPYRVAAARVDTHGVQAARVQPHGVVAAGVQL